MRTFDETGKEFLTNYLGREYAALLPSLEERHAVFFGRASSCENPVLIRLNDGEDFRKVFKKPGDTQGVVMEVPAAPPGTLPDKLID